MDNVQNCDRYINIPLSKTFRSFCKFRFSVGLIISDVLFVFTDPSAADE
jgi:hypothetical protein